MSEEDDSWKQQVLVGVAMLIVVGLLIGGIVAWIGLKAADVAGLTSNSPTTSAPSFPSTAPPSSPSPTKSTSPAPTTTSVLPPSGTPGFSLTASPTTVTSYQKIYLTGSYPGSDGATLQVQREENGVWADFATVTATVSGGSYTTYIESGHTGLNNFRLIDKSNGYTSNVAIVTIR
ncbi:MAG: hypothetical protein ACR2KG_00400 [Nocardioidaceae bacterium]